MRQRAVVGQQQQAFAVMVETAGGIDILRQAEPGQVGRAEALRSVNWHSTP